MNLPPTCKAHEDALTRWFDDFQTTLSSDDLDAGAVELAERKYGLLEDLGRVAAGRRG